MSDYKQDIQERVYEAIRSDDSYNEEVVLKYYEHAKIRGELDTVDSIFIALCGYSLKTLIEGEL